MTRQEHIEEAERLLAEVEEADLRSYGHLPYRAELIAKAQVHATLALALSNGVRPGQCGDRPPLPTYTPPQLIDSIARSVWCRLDAGHAGCHQDGTAVWQAVA